MNAILNVFSHVHYKISPFSDQMGFEEGNMITIKTIFGETSTVT